MGERRYSWGAIPAPGGSVPKGRAFGASGFLFFLLLVLMPYSAAGLNQTLNIVAVSSESEYQVGDRATVTTHILSAGAHADASTIDVILNHLRPMQRFVPVEQVATGVYESSFEILAADVLALAVRVSVRASVGSVQDYRIHYLFIDYKEIEVTSSTPRGSPGDLVDITVRIRQNGLLRDAPTLVLVARIATVGNEEEEPEELRLARTELGTYRAQYEVPHSITQDTAVSFFAWETAEVRISGGAVLFVDVPTKLLVWYHEVTLGPSETTLEVLVANETGWPEADARVALNYAYFDPFLLFSERNVSVSTDARGVASFTVSYPDARSTVGFWGTASTSSATQGFSGSLVPSTFVSTRKYEIVRDNPLDVLPPGEIASLRYAITEDGAPMSGQVLFYYALTGARLVAHGEVRSDDSGHFTIASAIPAGTTTIEFASRVSEFWFYDRDTVFSAHRLAVDLGEVFVGSMTRLVAALPDEASPWIALITFFPYRVAQGSFENSWAPASGSLAAYDVAVGTGKTLDHTVVVPRFLPKGEDYVLLVYAFPHRPVVTDADIYMFVQTIRIDNLPPTAVAQPTSLTLTTESVLEIDAAASFDRDGVVAAYDVSWGDGSITGWTADPSATHRYRHAGEYTVTIRVQDDNGAIGEVTYSVLVQATTFGMPTSIVLSAVGATTITAAAASLLLWRRLRRPPTPPL